MITPIIEAGKNTVIQEYECLKQLESYIDASFEKAVNLIKAAKGRFIISGIGKSALVANKIVATLNSTGTPSLFLHAADAIHGDLGMIQPGDVVMIISKSGESPEIKALLPLVKNFGNTLIGMTGDMHSFLSREADIVLNTTVIREACPNNLAPTSSTTVQMVMGDAISVALMEEKHFTPQDFARFHPGGNLGKRMYLRVKDLYGHNEKPAVGPHNSVKQVIVEMTKKELGVTAVVDQQERLLGIITDGDLRRMLEHTENLNQVEAADICTLHPKTVSKDILAVEALEIFRKFGISQLAVTENGKYLGILHLHDLVREGII